MGTEMSQHEKLTLEKKIPAPILPGLEPETFRSGVRRSITELLPGLEPENFRSGVRRSITELLPGLEPETFRSGVRRSITELSALIELYLSYTQHLYKKKKKKLYMSAMRTS